MTPDEVHAGGSGSRELVRDAVLVSIQSESGKLYKGALYVAPAALLAELVHREKVAVEGSEHPRLLVVRDDSPTGEKHLDASLDVVKAGMGRRRLRKLIGIVPQTAEVLRGLVREGEVLEQTKRRLGVKVRRYQPAPGSRHDDLVRSVRGVLLGEAVPDHRTALLVCSLVGVAPDLFVERADRKQARRRIEEAESRLSEDEQTVITEVRRAMSSDSDPSAGAT